MRWQRIALYLVVGISALLLTAVALLLTIDLGRFKGQIENIVTNVLGRELRVEGVLHAYLGRNIEIYAERATLANPDASIEPYFVAVDRVDVSIDAWSLIKGRLVVIDRGDAEGVDVNLEMNQDGSASWRFEGLAARDKAEKKEVRRPRLPVVLDNVDVRNSAVSFRAPRWDESLELEIDSVQATQTADSDVRIVLEGLLNDTPLSIDTTTGPVANIVDFRDVETEVKGSIGEISIKGFSKIDDLLAPRRPEFMLDIHGPNAEYVSEILEQPAVTSGPMDFEARIEPQGERMQISIDGTYGEFDLRIDGAFKDMQQRTETALDVFADGPDIGSIGRLFGLKYSDADPFELSGKVNRMGDDLTIDDVLLTIGESRLTAKGFFGEFPSVKGAVFKLEATGPDFGHFNRLFGMPGRLHGEFKTTLELAPQDDGRTQVALAAQSPDLQLKVNGMLSAEERLVGTTATVEIRGPDIGNLTEAAGFPKHPLEAFEVRGEVTRSHDGYTLQNMRALVGDDVLKIDGHIADRPLAGRTRLQLDVHGSDLGDSIFTLGSAGERLPKGVFHLRGRVEPEEDALRLSDFDAAIGDDEEYKLTLNGLLTREPNFVDSDVSVAAHGTSLSALAELVGIQGIPDYPFDVTANLRRGDLVTFVKQGDFEVGNVDVTFSGFLGDKPLEQEMQLTFDASVTDLRAVIATFEIPTDKLPPGDLAVSGSLRKVNEHFSADGIVATMNGTTLKVDGDLGLPPEFADTRLRFQAEGEDLAKLLPEESERPVLNHNFTADGVVTLQDDQLSVGGLRARLGNTRLGGDVSLSLEPLLERGSFSLQSDSPNLLELLEIPEEMSVPDAVPMQFTGSGSWAENYWNFDEFDLRISDGSLIVTGSLDGPPGFDRTDLQVELKSSSLRSASALAGRKLPDQPVRLTARMRGSRDEMAMENFELSFGQSDLNGQFAMHAGDVPEIDLDVQSELFDISEFLPNPADQAEPEAEAKKDRIIPDTPLPMELLRRYNAVVDADIGELRTRTQVARELALDATLKDGDLQIGRFGFVGQRGGNFEATASLTPNAADAPDLSLAVTGNDLTMGLVADTDDELQQLPLYDLQAELHGRGATLRELTGSMNGYVRVVGGNGRVKQDSFAFLTQDFLSQILETINPFVKKDPYVTIACSALLLTIDDGTATGKPVYVQQTDKVRILANANIDLKTEKLSVVFNTIPQKGLGISLSNLINPYVKISGTLAEPSLAMDASGALVQGGAAVATAGLSIVAKAFHDRFLTGKDPCAKAVKEADKKRAAAAQQP